MKIASIILVLLYLPSVTLAASLELKNWQSSVDVYMLLSGPGNEPLWNSQRGTTYTFASNAISGEWGSESYYISAALSASVEFHTDSGFVWSSYICGGGQSFPLYDQQNFICMLDANVDIRGTFLVLGDLPGSSVITPVSVIKSGWTNEFWGFSLFDNNGIYYSLLDVNIEKNFTLIAGQEINFEFWHRPGGFPPYNTTIDSLLELHIIPEPGTLTLLALGGLLLLKRRKRPAMSG